MSDDMEVSERRMNGEIRVYQLEGLLMSFVRTVLRKW